MSEVHFANGARAAKARASAQAKLRAGKPSCTDPPDGMVDRLREYPNGRKVALEFRVSHAFVCKVAKHRGIRLEGRSLDSGNRHRPETIVKVRTRFMECGSLGQAAKDVGVSYDSAKEWCRIYGWRCVEPRKPEVERWRCDCGRLNTGKDCTQCGNLPAWAKPDEPWTGDR